MGHHFREHVRLLEPTLAYARRLFERLNEALPAEIYGPETKSEALVAAGLPDDEVTVDVARLLRQVKPCGATFHFWTESSTYRPGEQVAVVYGDDDNAEVAAEFLQILLMQEEDGKVVVLTYADLPGEDHPGGYGGGGVVISANDQTWFTSGAAVSYVSEEDLLNE